VGPIDDANVSVAERVKAFKNRGLGSFNSKDYDRAIKAVRAIGALVSPLPPQD